MAASQPTDSPDASAVEVELPTGPSRPAFFMAVAAGIILVVFIAILATSDGEAGFARSPPHLQTCTADSRGLHRWQHIRSRRRARSLGGGQLLQHDMRAVYRGAPRTGCLRRGILGEWRRVRRQHRIQRHIHERSRLLRDQRGRLGCPRRGHRAATRSVTAWPQCPRPTSLPPRASSPRSSSAA